MKKDIISNPVMWTPSDERINSSQMFKFIKVINNKYNLDLTSFPDLHSWSVKNKSKFWSSIWDFFEVIFSLHLKYETVKKDY